MISFHLVVGCSLLAHLIKIMSCEGGRSIYPPTDVFFWDVESLIKNTSGGGARESFFNDFVNEVYKYNWYCLNASDPTDLVNYKHKYNTYSDFSVALKDLTRNVTNTEFVGNTKFTFWFPVLKPILGHVNVTTIPLIKTKTVAVVTLRKKVNIAAKYFTIYKAIDKFLIMAVLLAVVFGILFWLLDLKEKGWKSSVQGLSDGLWWSFNAMTSVGFGDVRPKRCASKVLGVIWMVMGLGISAGLVSFAEEQFERNEIKIRVDYPLAVLNGSKVADLIKETPKYTAKEFNTYEEMFEAIRNKDLQAAAINGDIAAYKQETWNDDDTKHKLTVVKTIIKPTTVYLAVRGDLDSFAEQYQNRCTINWDEIVRNTEFKHKKDVQVTAVYTPGIYYMLTKDDIIVPLLCLAGGMIAMGIIFDIVCLIIKKCHKNKSCFLPQPLEEVREDDGSVIKISGKEFKILQDEMAWIHKMLLDTAKNQTADKD